MSVEVYGITKIKIRTFEGEHSLWWDTITESNDKVNCTIRIPRLSFIKQMRKALDKLEEAGARGCECVISVDEVVDASCVEAKAS